ncbi:MAG: hypothetical protein A2Y17_11020 [Clostridiales bacterium GWF2_38_85]|nr:MAG: hypothetical protein A2Y17_11020 [Clostridiales bacterium GWF2_38_85]HBL84658.1 hypothetical protein [Clostridiales bacterium]
MNLKILPYVNYLLDNKPSPFCEYIICKELIHSDEQTVRDTHDWAIMFKLYSELRDEQLPDGSWGGFDDMIAEQAKRNHFKATARAMHRMLDLSLDINDPMVLSTVEICRKYATGEKSFPNVWGKNNWGKPIATRQSVVRWLSYFYPNDVCVVKLREQFVERLKTVCKSGHFDEDSWNETDFIYPGVGAFSYDMLYILSSGDCISDELQRIWLTYEWYKKLWYNGNLPSETKTPDDPSFAFWLVRLEYLRNFSLFGEFMEKEVAPYLYKLCERLIDPADDMVIKTNNYFYHHGQYSEAPRNMQHKKNDLLLRIIRLLNKCF